MNAGMYSSTCEWETPQALFDRLNAIYHFETDVCSTPENAKCAKYYTREQDGPERAKLRSKTYEGIALAMAEQWGGCST